MGEKQQRKLPKGVTIRTHRTGSETLVISFTFRGERCREPLSGLPVTTGNIRYASGVLADIYNRIERDTFDYAGQFPNSVKALKFSNPNSNKTVIDYLKEYIATCEVRGMALSSIVSYRGCLAGLSPLHDLTAKELTPARLKEWIIGRNVATKTIRNQMSVLRLAIEEAVTEGVIAINPCSQVTIGRYKNIKVEQEDDYVDPFTPDEIDRLLSVINDVQYANYVDFAFSCGMRPSELLAISWGNIDFHKKTARVENAVVLGVEKSPKTKAGYRDIELNDRAMAALIRQKPFSFLAGDRVFLNPATGKPWTDSNITANRWRQAMKRSGVRYRNQYQTRHTFATMNISQGANLFWLSSQMGHSSPEMLFKHYGRYLKEYDGRTQLNLKTA